MSVILRRSAREEPAADDPVNHMTSDGVFSKPTAWMGLLSVPLLIAWLILTAPRLLRVCGGERRGHMAATIAGLAQELAWDAT